MRLSFIILSLLFIISCSSDSKESKEQKDEHIQAIAGDSYSDNIRIPVSAYGPVDSSQMPKIEFLNPVFDFDTIYQGDVISHPFTFKNTGKSDLSIVEAKVSCGCTVAEIPEEAIKADSIGVITAEFNSENKIDNQEKNIIIISNTYPNETIITLKGFVKKRKN